MRSAIVAAAFAANALAVPFVKRDEVVVTDIDIVYATDIVTIYATAGAPPASTPDANNNFGHWGHSWGGAPWSPSSAYVPPAPETTTTSVYTPPPAPTTTSTTSVYTPPPAPTSTSVYVAPAPTSTWVAPAPAAPATTAAPGGTWGDDVPAGADVATGTFQVNDPVTWTESAAYTAYSDVVVAHHNFHRFNHSSQMLAWNESLAKSAQDLANTCSYGHNTDMDGGGYGQNIAAGVDMNNITTVITDLFYNGEAPWYDGLYGQAQPDMTNFEHWGHFSQIVWNETLSVACATSNCTAGGLGNVGSDTPPFFTVCNYWPSGNWANEYGANIGSPKNIPTIQWNAS